VTLLCILVKIPIVYAHPLASREVLGDLLALFIGDCCHPSLFGHNLNGANLFAIWYEINDTGTQEF
jgi:hypothetical protein